MVKKSTIAYLATSLWLPICQADIQTIIVGGGNVLENSQGQIESNVVWLQRQLKPLTAIKIYYTNGSDPAPDVVYWEPDAANQNLSPLTDILYPPDTGLLRYKKNNIPDVAGSTAKPELMESLQQDMQALDDGDDLLFIYNGHGGIDDAEITNNYLKLWNDTTLTVTELDQIFDQSNQGTTIRFVLTQCYSGAFAALTLESPSSGKPSSQNRCGFMSESAYREAEGCDLGIQQEDFRDYTTFFYAALTGNTRTGEALADDPDLNQDSLVSFSEAHFYTLRNAYSSDLSRSTSETFLEKWEPWYLRWNSWRENKDSIYWQTAQSVAENFHITMDSRSLYENLTRLDEQLTHNTVQQENTLEAIENRQTVIKESVFNRWPKVESLFTTDSLEQLGEERKTIEREIQSHSEYSLLIKHFETYRQLQQQSLDLKRKITQIEKILRLKKLARLQGMLEQYGSSEDNAQYRRLQSCEDGYLN